MQQLILHIDIDAFFASVEQNLNPELINIPFAVSTKKSNGVISTSNYIAREFGVFSGMKTNDALKLCPNLKIVNCKMKIYKLTSFQIFEYLHNNYTNDIEILSIDECCLDITNLVKKYNNIDFLCSKIKSEIKKLFNLNITIGVGWNKYTAKLLNDFIKPNNFTNYLQTNIHTLKIDYLKNINKNDINNLKENNIFIIKQFLDPNNASKIINIITESKYFHLLKSINKKNTILKNNFKKPNQISETFNFNTKENNLETIKKSLIEIYNELKSNNILLKYDYLNFSIYFKQNKKVKRYCLKQNLLTIDFKIVWNLFLRKWNKEPIEYIGISLTNIVDKQLKIW